MNFLVGLNNDNWPTAIDPRGDALADALIEADKMLAAMRKGEA